MTKRQDMSFLIALCAALGAYSILVHLAADNYTREAQSQLTGPTARTLAETPVPISRTIPLISRQDRIGDAQGTGDAIMQSPGDEPLLARQGEQTQAFLSRDPEGFGNIGSDPSPSVLPQGAASAPPAPPAAPEPPAVPFGVPQNNPPSVPVFNPKRPEPIAFAQPTPVEATPTTQPVKDQPTADPKKPSLEKSPANTPADASAQRPLSVASAQPASPAPSADPAPQSDSETDPFTPVGAVEFRPGKTRVQFGRKVKLTRPKFTLSGEFDRQLLMRSSSLVLGIHTDTTGNVSAVEILRSSGSNEIDLPCQRAAYEWWFEPPKDASGRPRADVIPFAIKFR